MIIEYLRQNGKIKVLLDKQIRGEILEIWSSRLLCGDIRVTTKNYQYFPKGQKTGEQIFSTLTEVKNALHRRCWQRNRVITK